MLDPRYGRAPWGGPVYSATRGLLVGNGLNMLRILPVLATQAYLYHFLTHRALKPHAPAFPFVPPDDNDDDGNDTAADPAWALTLGTTGAGMGVAHRFNRRREAWESGGGQEQEQEGDSDSGALQRQRLPPPLPLPLEAKHMVAGGFAGVVANLLVHPLDTVRARITAQTAGSRPYAGGALDCARRLVREEGGVRALWRGALPCSLWAFFYIGIHSTCLAVLAPLSERQAPVGAQAGGGGGWGTTEKERRRAQGVALASVLGAGAVAQLVAYPFDLVRRRMQLSGPQGPGMWATARAAMAEAGAGADAPKLRLRGLYRGFPVLLLKLLPTTLVSYRLSRELLERLEG
jgi:hypothetical protein